jgi:uncharacterized protein
MSASLVPPPPEALAHPAAPCCAVPWPRIHDSVPAVRTVHSIDLDVTESCNLACVYCFKWQKKPVHMDEATAKHAIDWLLEASGDFRGELKVNLMGGEPLLRFDLIRKIVPYGKCRARQQRKSLHFGCTTNCTRLTDEMMAFWRRFGMGFHCSIDGIPEVQNANRPMLGGGPSSPALEKNVPKILAYRPQVMARATISPRSVRSLLESAKYLARLGFSSITFKAAVNCEWKEEDFEALRSQYEKLGEFYVDGLVAGRRLNVEELRHGLKAIHSVETNSRFPCGAGRGVILVDPRGEFWPCHRFGPHQCGGQFRLGRIGEPFNDRMRAVFLDYNILEDTQAGCATCPAALTCRSWCYAECVDSTRTFYDPGKAYCRAIGILHREVLHLHDHLRSHRPDLLRALLKEP